MSEWALKRRAVYTGESMERELDEEFPVQVGIDAIKDKHKKEDSAMDKPQFGPRIKLARQAACMSQQALADAIGKSKMAISKYERDILIPSYGILQDIGNATGLQMEFFLRPTVQLDIELIHWHGI